MENWILKDILIIFMVSIPVVYVLQRLRLPPMLGFLISGAVIGPQGLGWIADKENIDILAEIGVTLLLFSVGLEFSFENLQNKRKQSFLAGFFQIILTIGSGLVIAKVLGWTNFRGFYFGCILALSSTAVVMTTLFDHRLTDSLSGRYSTVILVMQDLALIPMIVLLQWWGTNKATQGNWYEGLIDSVLTLGGIIVAFICIRMVANWGLKTIFQVRSREIFILTVVCVALGFSWLTQRLGLSFALGAFLGGMIIGTTPFKYQALADISPFRYAFNSLFFVSIGMLFDFHFVKENYLLIALLVFVIPSLKTTIISGVLGMLKVAPRVSLTTGIYLGQIGEFSFLLAYIGKTSAVIDPFFYQLIVATAVFTMILTPFMIFNANHFATQMTKKSFFSKFLKNKKIDEWSAKTKKVKDHVIICGFGPLGRALGKILNEHKIPYVVIDLDPRHLDMENKDHHILFGDGTSDEVLLHSGIERARMLAITVPDFLNNMAIIKRARHLNDNILVITRSKFRNEVEKYYEAGANIVISEELESGIEMGRYVLKELDISHDTVDRYVEKIREFGSADFF